MDARRNFRGGGASPKKGPPNEQKKAAHAKKRENKVGKGPHIATPTPPHKEKNAERHPPPHIEKNIFSSGNERLLLRAPVDNIILYNLVSGSKGDSAVLSHSPNNRSHKSIPKNITSLTEKIL